MSTRPPLLNQLSLPDVLRSFDCGETATSAILQALGIADTPTEEISDLNHNGSTQDFELIKLLTDNGLTVSKVVSSTLPSVLVASRTYGLLLIHDDNNADPSPTGPNLHWIVAYAVSGGSIQCVNPWGGRDIAYPWGNLLASTIETIIVTGTTTGVIMAGGCFRPGTHEFHWCTINPDKSVEHCYADLAKGLTVTTENLGGVAGGPAGVTWAPDGALCVVDVVGSDGKGIVLKVWQGTWGGWSSTGTTTNQLGTAGPPGKDGAPGTTAPHSHTVPGASTSTV